MLHLHPRLDTRHHRKQPAVLGADTMTDDEKEYRDRSKRLFQAGVDETDPDLKAALLEQSQRIGMRAIMLELKRKQEILTTLGIPLSV
jgi:arylsulfatase A-like enzyme